MLLCAPLEIPIVFEGNEKLNSKITLTLDGINAHGKAFNLFLCRSSA